MNIQRIDIFTCNSSFAIAIKKYFYYLNITFFDNTLGIVHKNGRLLIQKKIYKSGTYLTND